MQKLGSSSICSVRGVLSFQPWLLGIDLTSGKPPSMLQASKLFLNADVRDAAKNLVEEFKKAGIDVNAKVNIMLTRQLLWSTNLKRTQFSDIVYRINPGNHGGNGCLYQNGWWSKLSCFPRALL